MSKILKILFVVIVLGGGIICTEIEMKVKHDRIWFDSYPMANQHIEWSYAKPSGE